MKLTEKRLTTFLLIFAVLISAVILVIVFMTIPSPDTRIIRMEQLYALIAVSSLYFFFVVSPFYLLFPKVTGRKLFLASRETLLVITWYFGLLHTLLVFFGQLGGFAGLPFLSNIYLLAITLSFSALIILCIFTIGWVRKRLLQTEKKKKKYFSYLLSVVGLLLLVHALLVGSHFSNLSTFIPQVFILALFVLIGLQSIGIDRYLTKKHRFHPPVGILFSLVVTIFLFYTLGGLFIPSTPFSLGIHAEHLKSLEKAGGVQPKSRGSNFMVTFGHPDEITPQSTVPLSFSVFTRARREPVVDYTIISEKYMHVIVVDSSLSYFNHIHPQLDRNSFAVDTVFPLAGTYHIYSEFEPKNAPEQLFSFVLPVGDATTVQKPTIPPDTNFTKQFGDYSVALSFPQPLKAADMNLGQTEMNFTLRHALDARPVTTLRPYLGNFGHMVMIKESDYSYLHVHPGNLAPVRPVDQGGPSVSFYPLGLYQPITPGVYRIFAQFNPDGKLFTADFTVEIE